MRFSLFCLLLIVTMVAVCAAIARVSLIAGLWLAAVLIWWLVVPKVRIRL
jgi:hypothetical protein